MLLRAVFKDWHRVKTSLREEIESYGTAVLHSGACDSAFLSKKM